MKQGRMAPMSNQNKLQLVDITKFPELDLKEVENQLVAPNLIFQKIKLLQHIFQQDHQYNLKT